MTDHSAPTRGAMELARRIVGEFRPNGWESKVEEVAHALDRYRLATIEECAKIAEQVAMNPATTAEALRNLGRGA